MSDLVISPHPLTLAGQRVLQAAELCPGETLAQSLTRAGVDLASGDWVVTIGGAQVPRLMWDRTKPRHGQLVECRRVAGKKVLTLVAIVFIAWVTMGSGLAAMGFGAQAGMSAAAIAGTGVSGLAGALGMSAGFAALAVNAGAMMLGSMLVNKLLPPAKVRMPNYDTGTSSQTYSLSGGRNAARPYEPLGLIFGQVRVLPDYAAQPYQWFAGDDQYQYARLHGGINCGNVTDLRIGDTSIADYDDVEVSRSGFPGESTHLTDWSSVDTIAGGTLDAPAAPGAWVVRTSSIDTVRLAVDIGGSLYRMNDDGGMEWATVLLDAEYRQLPSGAWTPLVGSSARIVVSSNATKPVRSTYVSGVLPAAQYEVRMRKATLNVTSTKAANSMEWGSLKSYQLDTQSYASQPHVGIKIRASGQISGSLDAVSWLATAVATPVWTLAGWVTQVTSNPGAQILQFARGIFDSDGRLMAGLGLTDNQIDIDGLQQFMLHCTDKGLRFDHWFDSQVSCGDVLDAMAAAGLGSISHHPGRLSVIWLRSDQPLRKVVAMPNIKRGSFRVDYATRELAEELEVSWRDRDSGWRQRALRVKAPGVGMPRDTARLAPVGVTTEAGAVLAARLTMAQSIYQRKSVTWEMDLEHLTFHRFSLIAMSHDLTKWGQSGRLGAASVGAGGIVSLQLDELIKPNGAATAWYIGLRLPREASYRVFSVQPVLAETHTLLLAEPWPAGVALPGQDATDPAHDTLWIFDFKSEPGQRLRVTAIEPTNDLSGARITAVPEGPEFWNYVTTGAYVPTPAPIGTTPLACSNVLLTQDRLDLNYDARAQLTVTFDVVGAYDHAQIWAAPTGEVLQFIGTTRTRRFGDWTVLATGSITVEVRPFNALGQPGSVASTSENVVLGNVVQPAFGVQYSADGLDWHSDFMEDDVYMRQKVGLGSWSAAMRIVGEAGFDATFIDYVFKRSPTQPETPTGDGTPDTWFGAPPAGTDPLWMSKASKKADNTLNGPWSTPVRLDGQPGESVSVEYSVNGATGWHAGFAFGDVYMRQRIGTGAWSAAIRIVGEQGTQGPQGPQGPQGAQGYQGNPGPDGTSSYVHIRYSNSNGGALLPSGTAGDWMGQYVDFSSADSVNPSRYTWTKVKGADGGPGTAGTNGQSTKAAYALVASSSTAAGTYTGASALPPANTWGLGETWSANVSDPGTNQKLLMTIGIYDPSAGTTTWAKPFEASLKVGQLSAITAMIGTLRTATSGARTEISDNLIKVYDASNAVRVQISS